MKKTLRVLFLTLLRCCACAWAPISEKPRPRTALWNSEPDIVGAVKGRPYGIYERADTIRLLPVFFVPGIKNIHRPFMYWKENYGILTLYDQKEETAMKRVLRRLLLAALLAAALSVSASAEEYSGQCGYDGHSVHWTLDTETGLLTVSGQGMMLDMNWGEAPWYPFVDQITAVVVEEGVYSIGSYAFAECVNLKEAKFAPGMATIHEGAFAGCESLALTLPEGVEYIGDYAFAWCDFDQMYIPASVTDIGESAFVNSVWAEFKVAEGSTSYKTDERGVLYTAHGKTLVACPWGLAGPFTVPEGVTYIASQAFSNCSYITTMHLPASLRWHGWLSFDYAVSEGYTVSEGNKVYFADDDVLYARDGEAFLAVACPENKTGTLSVLAGTKEIEPGAFSNCGGLTRISLPEGVTHIGRSAFSACGALREVELPGSLTWVDELAFAGCRSLETVYFNGSAEQWNSVEIRDADRELRWAQLKVRPDGVENQYSADIADSENRVALWLDTENWAEEDYCVVVYSEESPDLYHEISLTQQGTCGYFEAVRPGVYDRVRVLLGAESRFDDPNAVILGEWTPPWKIEVRSGGTPVPKEVALQEYRDMRTQTLRWRVLGTDAALGCTVTSPEGTVYPFVSKSRSLRYFTPTEECDSVEIRTAEVFREDGYLVRRVSEPVVLEIPTLEEGYELEYRLTPQMLYGVLHVPQSLDQTARYKVVFYRPGSHESYSDIVTPGEPFPLSLGDKEGVTRWRVSVPPEMDGVFEYLADLPLSEPFYYAPDSFAFPHEVTVGVLWLGPDEEGREYAYYFDGLHPADFSYRVHRFGEHKDLTLPYFVEKDHWRDSALTAAFAVELEEGGYLVVRSEEVAFRLASIKTDTPTVALRVVGGGTVTVTNRRHLDGREHSQPVTKVCTTEGEAQLSFSAEERGLYDLTVSRSGCLTATVKDVEVDQHDVIFADVILVAGDTNGDEIINIMDMGAFRVDFGKTGEEIGNPYTDVNGDGMVNIVDMGTFRSNFGKTAAKDCTVEFSAQLQVGAGDTRPYLRFKRRLGII